MNPTDHRHILGNQMELALPPIAVEAVVIERMMAVIAENSSNVALCGDSIMLLQQKVESLTSAVFALVEAYRRQAGPKEAAAAHAEATALDELAEPPAMRATPSRSSPRSRSAASPTFTGSSSRSRSRRTWPASSPTSRC